MRSARLAAVALAGAAAAVIALPAAPAAAKTTTCKPGRYQLVLPGSIPAVSKLRAIDLPRLTDGYAPRCLVAEATAAEAQRGAADGKPPAELNVYGARWGVGRYTCTYEAKTGYTQAQCRHNGKDANTVRFRLVS